MHSFSQQSLSYVRLGNRVSGHTEASKKGCFSEQDVRMIHDSRARLLSYLRFERLGPSFIPLLLALILCTSETFNFHFFELSMAQDSVKVCTLMTVGVFLVCYQGKDKATTPRAFCMIK